MYNKCILINIYVFLFFYSLISCLSGFILSKLTISYLIDFTCWNYLGFNINNNKISYFVSYIAILINIHLINGHLYVYIFHSIHNFPDSHEFSEMLATIVYIKKCTSSKHRRIAWDFKSKCLRFICKYFYYIRSLCIIVIRFKD